MNMSSGDSGTLNPGLAGLLEEIEAGLASITWQQLLSNTGYALLVVLFIGMLYSGLRPFLLERFDAQDIMFSRLFIALAPLPVIFFFAIYKSRFRLTFFRLDKPMSKIRFVVPTLIGCGLLYWLFPTGSYISQRSKAIMKVYYATDRKPSSDVEFSSDVSDPPTISYGVAYVPVYWSYREIEWNWKTLFEWVKGEPIPVRVSKLDSEAFFTDIADDARRSPRHEALMFVHGFRNLFGDALATTGKLAYDLKFGTASPLEGVIILYSWPSNDSILGYGHDSENANWSIDHLTSVLLNLENSRMGLEHLQLLAHSMGTRVLGAAVKATGQQNNSKPTLGVQPRRVDNIVFAAADLDEPMFVQISPFLRQAANRVTLYINTWDVALLFSSGVHESFRVGQLPVPRDGVDVIDTLGMDTSILKFNHSYLFDSQPLLVDMFPLIRSDAPPDQRVAIERTDNACWQFQHR